MRFSVVPHACADSPFRIQKPCLEFMHEDARALNGILSVQAIIEDVALYKKKEPMHVFFQFQARCPF